MARGKKTDIETKAKVISSKLLDIDKTLEEIWEETNLPKSTVADILDNDLPEVRKSSEIIASIIENDMESVKEMSELTKMFMKQIKKSALDEWIDKAELAVANTTAESALKRSQLLQGKATERIAIEDLSSLSPKQLEEERNKLL